MIGYVYKTTNLITGQFYIGKREFRKDAESRKIYYGSNSNILNNVVKYGEENFKKEILAECETLEEMSRIEWDYLNENVGNTLCLNKFGGEGFGGVYQKGVCKRCGKEAVTYSESGLCMSCIIGTRNQRFCEKCGRLTYRYQDGTCMSCIAKESHENYFCNQCQKETSHMGGFCKQHSFRLVKNGDKIELWNNRHKLISDIVSLQKSTVITTPRSVIYQLPEGAMKVKCNNELVELKNLIYNENVSGWLKISYRYDGRKDHIRSFVATEDHPMPILSGAVKRADELVVGDKFIRTNIKSAGSGKQWNYAEIISIEPYIQTKRSYDITTETEYFDLNNDILSHNCRSFLTPYINKDGNPQYFGRFNQGVVTINLPDVALSANKDLDKFWEIFDERLELCHKALQCRHERLTGTVSDVAPILWQHGALLRLGKGEVIDEYLHGGYSTLSLGYAGLWECVYALIGKKLTEPEGEELGLKIMCKLNEYTRKWKEAECIDYSLYGTPIETTTYKFAKGLQKRFGIIEGVSDKNYITNSYHVHVTEPIDAFEKLAFEAKFQALSPGGAISYVEVPNMQDNIPAVLRVMQFIYDNIMYAELNTKSDFCQVCGYDGEIKIVKDEDGKLIWECPKCKNTDQKKMNVARRTCGYIGSQFWNQGRTQEIDERVMHL